VTRTIDELALLAAIRADPDDDTLRLAYADHLDNLDTVSASCPKCKNTGLYCRACNNTGLWDHSHFLDLSEEEIAEHGRPVTRCPQCRYPGKIADNCEPCKGTGFVPDTSDRDRAELIRVQCRLQVPPSTAPDHRVTRSPHCACNYCLDLAQEKHILTANADRWRKGLVCERCDGSGELSTEEEHDSTRYTCRHCFGTGDGGGLMREVNTHVSGEGSPMLPVKVEYVRGMKRVHCRAEDVWRKWTSIGDSPKVETWEPTEWALAVCRHHPDVVEVWVSDREPSIGNGFSVGHFGWCTAGGLGGGFEKARVPDPLIAMMGCELSEKGLWRWSRTASAARAALASTVVRWVHSHLTPHPV
jgi:uncharacterized protein (TIGR02996 family)